MGERDKRECREDKGEERKLMVVSETRWGVDGVLAQPNDNARVCFSSISPSPSQSILIAF